MSSGSSFLDDPAIYNIRQEASLDFDDWSPFAFVNGTFFCVKRSVALQVPLNEDLDWNQMEDIEWSHRAFDKGFVTTGIKPILLRSRVCKHPWINRFPQTSHGVGPFKRSLKDLFVFSLAMLCGPLLRLTQKPRMNKNATQYFSHCDLFFWGESSKSHYLSYMLGKLSYVLGDGVSYWIYLALTRWRLAITKNDVGANFFSMPAKECIEQMYNLIHFRPVQKKELENDLRLIEKDGEVGRLKVLAKRFCPETLTKHFACRIFN
jgi:hypothetical protein